LVPVDKLNKAFNHQKINFTRNKHGEKVIPAQREIALTISLLKLSIKERIAEQQEQLCKELYSDNPLKFWDKDTTFAKITLLNLYVLNLPNERDDLIVGIDVNNEHWSAALKIKEGEKLYKYFNRSFNKAECNYPTMKKEILIVIGSSYSF